MHLRYSPIAGQFVSSTLLKRLMCEVVLYIGAIKGRPLHTSLLVVKVSTYLGNILYIKYLCERPIKVVNYTKKTLSFVVHPQIINVGCKWVCGKYIYMPQNIYTRLYKCKWVFKDLLGFTWHIYVYLHLPTQQWFISYNFKTFMVSTQPMYLRLEKTFVYTCT